MMFRRIDFPLTLISFNAHCATLRSSEQAGYSIFTSGAYKATTPGVAFPQEKLHFAELECAE
jgi:hypothetical protein